MRISDWSSDVCSSDLRIPRCSKHWVMSASTASPAARQRDCSPTRCPVPSSSGPIHTRRTTGNSSAPPCRSEEHTSELQSLMRISYAVFCLKNKQCSLHLLSHIALMSVYSYDEV